MIERTQNPKFSSVQWLNKKPKQSLFKYNKQEDSMEPKYTFLGFWIRSNLIDDESDKSDKD